MGENSPNLVTRFSAKNGTSLANLEPILRLLNFQLQRQRWSRLERFSK
jgi:hypothetical protein